MNVGGGVLAGAPLGGRREVAGGGNGSAAGITLASSYAFTAGAAVGNAAADGVTLPCTFAFTAGTATGGSGGDASATGATYAAGYTFVPGGATGDASASGVTLTQAAAFVAGTASESSTTLSQADIDAIADAVYARLALPGSIMQECHDLLTDIEGTMDHREVMRILLAAMAGLASGAGTGQMKFRDVSDSKDRIAATLDGAGNRTGIVLNVSD